MPPKLKTIIELANRFLWDEPNPKGRMRAFTLWLIHLGYKLVLEFRHGQLTIRAASLVYKTILTIVPVLAVSFALLKSLGAHNKLQPLLYQFLEPLGSKGVELTDTIIAFVDEVKVGVLGTVGLALLLYTVISSIQQVESAFNYTWHVTNERNLLQKFRDYLSVTLAGPVMLVSAIGLTTTVMALSVTKTLQTVAGLGFIIATVGKLVPYLLVMLSFTLLYYLLPNTKVHFRSAIVGGVSAGILWQTGGLAFTAFVLSSAQYPAIYKGFAIMLLLIIWLYYNWIILLIGCKISFYHQHPTLLSMRHEAALCNERVRDRAALAMMYLIGASFYNNQQRWTQSMLVRKLQLPLGYIQGILDTLVGKGLLIRLADDHSYIPARDLDTIRISEVITVLRDAEGLAPQLLSQVGTPAGIDEILTKIDDGGLSSIGAATMKELVLAGSAGAVA